ncbi:hypothetical protein F8271_24225, partial [Micromonospora sp. ALFpr18c]
GPAAWRRGWLVGHPDVAGVALAGELGMPLGGRFDHPGRFVRIPPPVGVAPAHPPSPSPHPAVRPIPVRGAPSAVVPQ